MPGIQIRGDIRTDTFSYDGHPKFDVRRMRFPAHRGAYLSQISLLRIRVRIRQFVSVDAGSHNNKKGPTYKAAKLKRAGTTYSRPH